MVREWRVVYRCRRQDGTPTSWSYTLYERTWAGVLSHVRSLRGMHVPGVKDSVLIDGVVHHRDGYRYLPLDQMRVETRLTEDWHYSLPLM